MATNDFSKLKPGDEVIVYGKNTNYLEKVYRVTPSGQVVIKSARGNETRFNRHGSHGRNFDAIWIKIPTEDEIRILKAERRRRSALHALSQVQWDRFTTESLEGMIEGLRSGMMEKQKLELKK